MELERSRVDRSARQAIRHVAVTASAGMLVCLSAGAPGLFTAPASAQTESGQTESGQTESGQTESGQTERGFQVAGDPAETVTASDPSAASPQLTGAGIGPGRYRIELDPGERTEWVAVDKSPGASLWVTLNVRLPDGADHRGELGIITVPDTEQALADEVECGYDTQRVGGTAGWTGPLPLSLLVDPETLGTSSRTACMGTDRMLLGIGHEPENGTTTGLTGELLIIEEPQVQGAAGLPEADDFDDDFEPEWSGTGRPRSVGAGTSYPTAPTVAPGTYAGTITPGDVQLYRIGVDHGQRLEVTVRLPSLPTGTASRLPTSGLSAGLLIAGPSQQPLNGDGAKFDDEQDVIFGAVAPTLHYRNRESSRSAVRPASLAGYHYVLVAAEDFEDDRNVELPYELDLALAGDPGGAPTYIGDGAPTDPVAAWDEDGRPTGDAASGGDPEDDTSSTGSGIWPLAGPVAVGAGAALLFVAIAALLRRRARGGGGASPRH